VLCNLEVGMDPSLFVDLGSLKQMLICYFGPGLIAVFAVNYTCAENCDVNYIRTGTLCSNTLTFTLYCHQ
jgi:hypothetical protein